MAFGLHEIVDYGTVATAAAVPAMRYVRHWLKAMGWPPLLDGFVDTLRGAALFPCVMLIPGAFYPPLMEILMTTKREFVVLAGLYATISVWFSDRWLRNQMLVYYQSASTVTIVQPAVIAPPASDTSPLN